MKYKVGDKVILSDPIYKNESGEINRIDENDTRLPYQVIMYSSTLKRWFSEDQLSLQLPFPIGTRVKCYAPGIEPFTGIFQGQSEFPTSCWAIERDDNSRGVAQNGWWNWDKSFKTEPIEEISTLTTFSGECIYNATVGVGDIVQNFENHLPALSDAALEPAEPTGEFMYASTGYDGFPVVFGQDLCSEFIKTYNHKYMSIKNKIKMLMTGEPEKTLIKHGILTIDKELTSEGKQLFNDFIENKFKDEFLKELYEVLKDEKVDGSAQ